MGEQTTSDLRMTLSGEAAHAATLPVTELDKAASGLQAAIQQIAIAEAPYRADLEVSVSKVKSLCELALVNVGEGSVVLDFRFVHAADGRVAGLRDQAIKTLITGLQELSDITISPSRLDA
jgi:hypothetical protein